MNPSEEYRRRLQARRDTVEHYKRLDRLIGNARLIVGLAFFSAIWLAAGPHVVSGWWVLLPLVVFVVLVARTERVRASGRQAQRSVVYYERGLARIEDRWIGTGDPGRAFFDESHPYSMDLDIFGKGSLIRVALFSPHAFWRTDAGGLAQGPRST